jgi:hypothetical protein
MAFLATNNFGDTVDGSLAGPLGLVIILFLALGTFLLIRNMNQRLRRLPEHFGEPPTRRTAGPAADQADESSADESGTDDART